ncbi:YhcN/YlaJ family sporulation lipoprotein [Bacillus sp. UNC41MFS5]|uniref:YhcN/YlaJ family sporulation lipoprotein n=1 Tax=Bacillus sp. UNC41MFS5 TaxID=1449046 RepID=UPI00047ACF0E|nr:YhcN/YlaJ family sporulation lipoprotein [Bacillus sp. UNC41MFS5]
MRAIHQWVLLACLLLLSSCDQNQQIKDSQLTLIKTTNPSPIVTQKNKSKDHVKDIEQDVSSFPELYDVAVVKGKKDTLVVYKVKHLHRFRMKKIEKDINKMLEQKYPDENFTISSDYKIFLETVRLDERMNSSKYTAKKAENRFNQIVNMTKDLK